MGQNFLQDDSVATAIADAAEIAPGDPVVEIGPGTGAVTRHLIGRGRHTWLVEKDDSLSEHQRGLWLERPDVTLLHADATDVDLRPFFAEGPVTLVGNLPYSVGTAILTRWLENPSPVGRAVFMLQQEVCERLAASPRTKAYGQISVRLQARWHVRHLRKVPSTAFVPRPNVESAIVALWPRDRREFPCFDERLFTKLVQAGFSQRRKQLKNIMPPPPRPWAELCAAIGEPETVRAEELSVGQWIAITRLYDRNPLADVPQKDDEIFDVVDEQDRPVSQARRADVHAQGLRHRAIHAFVLNRRGELLLQKRSHLKDAHPSVWDSSAAGHLDAGESYAACALRELHEELGLKHIAETPVRVGKIDACSDTGWEFVEVYVTHHEGPFAFPAAEIECVQFFPPEELDRWTGARPQDFAPGFLRCYNLWRTPAAASNATV